MKKTFLTLVVLCLSALLHSCGGGGGKLTPKEVVKEFDLTLMPVHYSINGLKASGYASPDGVMKIDLGPSNRGSLCALFHEGLAYVRTDEMQGFINEDGELVVDLTGFEHTMSLPYFSEGLYLGYDKESKTTMAFDKKGNRVWEVDGVPVTQMLGGYALLGGGRWDIIAIVNSKGEIVFEPEEGESIPFAEYTYPAHYAHPSIFPVCRDGKVSYLIDVASGKRILEDALPNLMDDNVLVDCNDLVVLNTSEGYGIMDLKGNWVVEPQYDYIQNDGKWYVYAEDRECGWLDSKGEVVIPAQFKFYSTSDIPLFGSSNYCNVDQHTFINRKGEVALETEYFIQSNFIGVKSLVRDSNSYLWIDDSGAQLGEPLLLSDKTVDQINQLSRGIGIQYAAI